MLHPRIVWKKNNNCSEMPVSTVITTAKANPIATLLGVLGLGVLLVGLAKWHRESQLSNNTAPAPSHLDMWPSAKILLGVGILILLGTGLVSWGRNVIVVKTSTQ